MRFAAIFVALTLLAGCGGDSQNDKVRQTVDAWLSALAVGNDSGDNARACSYLTRGLQKSIDLQLRVRGEHASCKTFAAKWTGRSTPPGNKGAHVTKVVVNGAKARVSLAAPPDRTSDVQLRKIDGRWRIDNY